MADPEIARIAAQEITDEAMDRLNFPARGTADDDAVACRKNPAAEGLPGIVAAG